MAFRILSCDGGGIRGYISSTLIRDMNQATGGKLLANIDGFAGTSTGGLISIALAAGVDIDTMVKIYATEAAQIFTENDLYSAADTSRTAQISALANMPLAGPGLLECQYTSQGLRNVMQPYLGSKTFADVTGKLLMVNSAQLDNSSAFGGNWWPVALSNVKTRVDYSSVALLDAALATSAAPTYFPPHLIADLGYFADGGTFANNPVLNGIELALASGRAQSLADIQVISFGTGLLLDQRIPENAIGNPLDWGVSRWMWPVASDGVPATPLLNLMFDLSAENLGNIAGRLLGDNIKRINPPIPADHSVPLDGYTAQDYQYMNSAIDAAKHLTAWRDAIDMVNSW